jgi:hypothetical protein
MIFNCQGAALKDTKFSLLSTFYNNIDDDVNFFVTISWRFGGRVQSCRGSRFRGSGLERFKVLEVQGSKVLGCRGSRFKGSGL